MSILLLVSLILSGVVFGADESQNWALLIAGSNEYYNYRHQADICHAYQILHRNGIPDERIVVMMYDDIAYNEENPVQGEIINHPDGENVYNGTIKDYTKHTVTPGNFLKVLQGQKIEVGSKKVINSGPNDNVFVYFSDHGAPGLIAFPDGSALHASQLNKAIKSMHANKKFKNMVVYIEACESGSMFEKLLPENINVYATTAANSEESSYACYFDDKRQTYLGDLYSVNWLEDSDHEKIDKESLFKQFSIVKKLTNLSHVMEFGNLTMGKLFNVSQFQAESKFVQSPFDKPVKDLKYDPNNGAVKSEDVRLSILQKKLLNENINSNNYQNIVNQIKNLNRLKKIAVNTIREIASIVMKNDVRATRQVVETKSKLTNHECYVPVVDHLIEKCFTLKNEYVLRNLYVLVNLCETGFDKSVITKAIDAVCVKKFNDY